MSFETKMKELLTKNGMSETQADEVIKLAKADESLDSMKDRWNDCQSHYPEAMVNIVWISVKQVALRWIDDNMPLAWYRPIFAS